MSTYPAAKRRHKLADTQLHAGRIDQADLHVVFVEADITPAIAAGIKPAIDLQLKVSRQSRTDTGIQKEANARLKE